MTITKTVTENLANLALDGELDSLASTDLETALEECIGQNLSVCLDCAKVPFVSSAGLRVLLCAYKKVAKYGELTLVNITEDVHTIMFLSGFTKILRIK